MCAILNTGPASPVAFYVCRGLSARLGCRRASELVHAGHAPAAIVLHEPDAILLLGLIVAREMRLDVPIAVELDRETQKQLADHRVTVGEDGGIEIAA